MQRQVGSAPPAATASDGRRWVLEEGILAEPGLDADHLVLWLPVGQENGFRHWERIGQLPHTQFTIAPGVHAAGATLVRVRQRLEGRLGRLFRPFHRTAANEWVLPNGERALDSGARQKDLLLIWAEDGAKPLDEAWIESRWPQSSRRQRLGGQLYLVAGVQPPAVQAAEGPEAQRARECPHSAAQQMLDAARAAGDLRRQLDALADLGAAYLHEGHAEHAVKALGEALQLATDLDDRSRQSEIYSNLGWLTLAAGAPARALEIFERALGVARDAENRFTEKTALERIGLAHVRLGNPVQAIEAFEQALAVACEVGHRKHQADLLWYLGVEYAELGRRDQVLAHAQAAIDLMQKMRDPRATWYAKHLQEYRTGEAGAALGGIEEEGPTAPPEMPSGEVPVASFWSLPPGSSATQGPGLLRMALSATKSMAQFIGSGFKTASPGIVQHRLRTCAACEHHTGLRCRLCGCFTSAKARLAHEECPIGKWPA
jgi:tetratricopeptide (TPR) repeat protein